MQRWVVAVGRWGNQDMDRASAWPIHKLYRVYMALVELITLENTPSKKQPKG